MKNIEGLLSRHMEGMHQFHKDFMELARLAMSDAPYVEPEDMEEEVPESTMEEVDENDDIGHADMSQCFTEDEINLDDPRWASGMTMGVPREVYLGGTLYPPNMLYPIIGGLFREGY